MLAGAAASREQGRAPNTAGAHPSHRFDTQDRDWVLIRGQVFQPGSSTYHEARPFADVMKAFDQHDQNMFGWETSAKQGPSCHTSTGDSILTNRPSVETNRTSELLTSINLTQELASHDGMLNRANLARIIVPDARF
jgi:hypothetical protein